MNDHMYDFDLSGYHSPLEDRRDAFARWGFFGGPRVPVRHNIRATFTQWLHERRLPWTPAGVASAQREFAAIAENYGYRVDLRDLPRDIRNASVLGSATGPYGTCTLILSTNREMGVICAGPGEAPHVLETVRMVDPAHLPYSLAPGQTLTFRVDGSEPATVSPPTRPIPHLPPGLSPDLARAILRAVNRSTLWTLDQLVQAHDVARYGTPAEVRAAALILRALGVLVAHRPHGRRKCRLSRVTWRTSAKPSAQALEIERALLPGGY